MKNLNVSDLVVIVLYLSVLVGLSLFLKKQATKSLEDYFLGGKKVPWWVMGISGMSSYVDMAGTMLIVSFLYMLGPRGLFIEFRGGAVLILVFMLLWSGKWHYRSGCMTGAEWMEFRFGSNWGGQVARVISLFAVIVTTVGMLAYMIKAIGLFTSMFIPLPPAQCALIMILIATTYTMLSGFYGVAYTDLFQAFIVVTMIIIISVLAFIKIGDGSNLAVIAEKVTGNNQWTHTFPSWKVYMPKGYEVYQDLIFFAFFYLLRNICFGISSAGADPRYFGARNERECGTLSFLWTSLMMLRWPMMIGFAVLGIFLVSGLFPDQNVVLQASVLVKSYLPGANKEQWQEIIAAISNFPNNYPAGLTSGLKALLGNDWQTKIHLVSFYGTINVEQIVPAVILFSFPIGLRGFFLIAFLAAAFSSFNSNVNSTTAYFIRDMYQRYFRPKAKDRELITAAYLFTSILVFTGFLFAYNLHSINQIWGWIIMGLGGGIAIPSMLKFYWWRYNGEGFAIGTATGIVTAILFAKFFNWMPEWQIFMIESVISLLATIWGTYLAKPVDDAVVENFYKKTKPFGFWKPYRKRLDPVIRLQMFREHRNEILAVPFTLCWQVSLFLLPMQIMIKSYSEFFINLVVFVVSLTGMYLLWYRNLPAKQKATE